MRPAQVLRGGDGESISKWIPIVVPLFAAVFAALIFFIAWAVL